MAPTTADENETTTKHQLKKRWEQKKWTNVHPVHTYQKHYPHEVIRRFCKQF